MTAFTNWQYYCLRCMVGSDHRYTHRCPDDESCYACRRHPTLHKDPLPVPKTCDKCFRVFRDSHCFDMHSAVVCNQSWFCTKCAHAYPYSHKRKDHVCYDSLCPVCKKYVGPDHQCYIQPVKAQAPIPKGKLRIFDFESDVTGEHHVPNFAAVCDEDENVVCYENGGGDIMQQFMKGEILNKRNKGCTYVAHNAKGYDTQFIRQELDKEQVKYEKIMAGRKILHLTIPALNIRIIDSHCFVSQPLSKFPKMFGLQGIKKGLYPYRFNTKGNWNYKGAMPAFSEFLPDGFEWDEQEWTNFKAKAEKDMEDDETKLRTAILQLKEWYDEQVAKNRQWDNYTELREYCIDDVKLLMRGLKVFRRDFTEDTKTAKWSKEGKEEGVDPLRYVTVAQACMAAMRHKFLDEDTIAYIPHTVDVHSLVSIQWMEYLAHCTGANILHARNTPNHSEVRVCGKKVDGFCRETNTVYEFNGCKWHGCPSCYPQDQNLRKMQVKKEQFFRSKGFRVVSVWECDFRHTARSQTFKSFLAARPQLTERLPLDVRAAFYGGRTNASRLYYKFLADHCGHYADFTSLYPHINATLRYPVGHPEILLQPSMEKFKNGEYFGVAKCTMLPPTNLYHPILPSKINDKLMFTLCYKCAKDNTAHCTHTDDQRALTGVWCTPELDLAMEHGYTPLALYEVHHFKESTKEGEGLMQDYVRAFLKCKQEASGWPRENMTESEKQTYIADYLQHEGIQLDPSKIEKNPGRRQCAKLMLNSLWGKFGQRGNMSTTATVYSLEELNGLMHNPELDCTSWGPSPSLDGTWQVTYCHVSKYVAFEPKTANVYVAAMTTSGARIKLWHVLYFLGMRVLYYDTDSIIYTQKKGEPTLPLGPYLGDLTSELEEGRHIVEFVSTGPKSYAYRDNRGATTVKFKGISKTLYNVQKVNLETMTQCVQDASFKVSADEGPRNMLFKIDPWGKLSNGYQSKCFQMTYTKRYIGNNYITYPFGYKEE